MPKMCLNCPKISNQKVITKLLKGKTKEVLLESD